MFSVFKGASAWSHASVAATKTTQKLWDLPFSATDVDVYAYLEKFIPLLRTGSGCIFRNSSEIIFSRRRLSPNRAGKLRVCTFRALSGFNAIRHGRGIKGAVDDADNANVKGNITAAVVPC